MYTGAFGQLPLQVNRAPKHILFQSVQQQREAQGCKGVPSLDVQSDAAWLMACLYPSMRPLRCSGAWTKALATLRMLNMESHVFAVFLQAQVTKLIKCCQ